MPLAAPLKCSVALLSKGDESQMNSIKFNLGHFDSGHGKHGST
jgi:hypothetical protein